VANPLNLVPRAFTPAEIADSYQARSGPAPRQLSGSHVLDLAAVGKFILLCRDCNPKFVPKGVGYIRWHRRGYVTGLCDGCAQFEPYGHAFIPEPLESAVGMYRDRPPRRGRWSPS
jgi:hypothetical protein